MLRWLENTAGDRPTCQYSSFHQLTSWRWRWRQTAPFTTRVSTSATNKVLRFFDAKSLFFDTKIGKCWASSWESLLKALAAKTFHNVEKQSSVDNFLNSLICISSRSTIFSIAKRWKRLVETKKQQLDKNETSHLSGHFINMGSDTMFNVEIQQFM